MFDLKPHLGRARVSREDFVQPCDHGFDDGGVYQRSRAGTLMGIASQSAIVREVSEHTTGRLPPWMTREIEAASDRAPTGTSE